MKVMTCKEAALRWRISQRRVQELCAQGRISGVRRTGRMWQIPVESQKPVDPRFSSKMGKNPYWREFFLLDRCLILFEDVEHMIEKTTDRLRKKQLIGEIAYMRGNFQQAVKCVDGLAEDSPGFLNALAVSTAAKVGMGDMRSFQKSWNHLKRLHNKYKNQDEVCKMIEVIQGVLSISAYAPQHCPSWIKEGVIDGLSEPFRMMALYLRAKSLLALGRIDELVSTVEAALSLNISGWGIQEVYLYIILAHGYIYQEKPEKAHDMLLHALSICMPHGFISPMAESISSLLGMGEKCLRKAYPQFLSLVLSLHRQLSPSWLEIHNMLTHEKITPLLTRREYQVALTVVGGLTNKECAQRLGISVSTVKGNLLSIYQKLNISSRKALKDYIISA